MNEEQKQEFMVSLNQLKEAEQKIKELTAREDALRDAYYEYDRVGREIAHFQSKVKKLYKYIEICNGLFNDELKEIGKKLIEAKEKDYPALSGNLDHRLFDEIKDHFVTISGKRDIEFHISLFYNHLRHYDLSFIMKRIEEITGFKIKGYYFMSSQGMLELSLELERI